MNEHSYDIISDRFASDRNNSPVHKYVAEFAGLLNPGDEVLDIGCGTGLPNAKFLADKGLRVTGIDFSQKLIDMASINVPNAGFERCDIRNYSTNKKFRGIIAWDSLFHLRPEDHEPVFRKISGLLLEKGCLLFTHGGKEGEITGEMFDRKFYYSSMGPDKTRILLESLGFEIKEWDIDPEGNGYMIGLAIKAGIEIDFP